MGQGFGYILTGAPSPGSVAKGQSASPPPGTVVSPEGSAEPIHSQAHVVVGRIRVLEGCRTRGLGFWFLAGGRPPSGPACEKVLGERECQQMGVGVFYNLISQVASAHSSCILFISSKSGPSSGEGSTQRGGCQEVGLPGSVRLTALLGHGGLSAVESAGTENDRLAGTDRGPALSGIRRPPGEKSGRCGPAAGDIERTCRDSAWNAAGPRNGGT